MSNTANSAEAWLADRRVRLGFLTSVLVITVARPTWASWLAGLVVAVAGEVVRVWAAGHLEKGREVTRTGPYRLMRHPLYVGSVIIAAGVVVACASLIAALVVSAYMIVTIRAAVRTEEAFLRCEFGDTYDHYRASHADPMVRTFSLTRARRNREYRAVSGLGFGFALLALKVLLLL